MQPTPVEIPEQMREAAVCNDNYHDRSAPTRMTG